MLVLLRKFFSFSSRDVNPLLIIPRTKIVFTLYA